MFMHGTSFRWIIHVSRTSRLLPATSRSKSERGSLTHMDEGEQRSALLGAIVASWLVHQILSRENDHECVIQCG